MKISKKVAFHTLGCRLNFSETGSIAQGFVDRGYKVVPFGEKADVVFINTCTVTDGADSTCRNVIRKANKSSPEGRTVVVGCYAQMESEKVSEMKGVDLILGTSEKFKVFDYLENKSKEQVIKVKKSNEFWGAATTPVDNHTRAFLKIQDGCNYVCSFCIIPAARGRSRTIPLENAIGKIYDLVDKGFKEVVLTGVNIGEYEATSGVSLAELVKNILAVPGLKRFRLSSVEPNTITDELIDVLKSSPKVMDHFHVPLQSGSDGILKSMRRKYDIQRYKGILEKLKRAFPHCAIGADIILGYPGEDSGEFKKTYELLKELPITHFHAFPYSIRKGTTAVKLEDHNLTAVKKERVSIVNDLGQRKLTSLAQTMVGKINNVLFERRNKKGLFEGYTTNFIKLAVESNEDLSNLVKKVYITGWDEGLLRGEIVDELIQK